MANETPTFDNSEITTRRRESAAGVAYGLACYLWWGFVAFYFKAIAHVPPLEVLALRVVGAVILLALLLRLYGRWGVAISALRHRITVITLIGTTLLIACNWLTFIWSIVENQLLQASLGYFINPLVNVVLGFLFLGERLRRWQIISVGIAACSVGYLTFGLGELPGLALILAFSFGFYGLLRKIVRVDSIVGLTVETTFLLPFAIAYLVYAFSTDRLVFGMQSRTTDVLLSLAGVVTAVPLMWFINAAKRLRLATLGFLQYIAPSLQFMLAVLVFGEEFLSVHMISFAGIWTALAVYSIDSAVHARKVA